MEEKIYPILTAKERKLSFAFMKEADSLFMKAKSKETPIPQIHVI